MLKSKNGKKSTALRMKKVLRTANGYSSNSRRVQH